MLTEALVHEFSERIHHKFFPEISSKYWSVNGQQRYFVIKHKVKNRSKIELCLEVSDSSVVYVRFAKFVDGRYVIPNVYFDFISFLKEKDVNMFVTTWERYASYVSDVLKPIPFTTPTSKSLEMYKLLLQVPNVEVLKEGVIFFRHPKCHFPSNAFHIRPLFNEGMFELSLGEYNEKFSTISEMKMIIEKLDTFFDLFNEKLSNLWSEIQKFEPSFTFNKHSFYVFKKHYYFYVKFFVDNNKPYSVFLHNKEFQHEDLNLICDFIKEEMFSIIKSERIQAAISGSANDLIETCLYQIQNRFPTIDPKIFNKKQSFLSNFFEVNRFLKENIASINWETPDKLQNERLVYSLQKKGKNLKVLDVFQLGDLIIFISPRTICFSFKQDLFS